MVEFLSEEWLAQLRSVLESVPVDDTIHAAVEHRVVDPEGTSITWHVAIRGGRLDVVGGPAPTDRRVGFVCDRDVARSIAAGEASAQRLFLDGRLRIDGDIDVLIAARPALDAVGDALATVRDNTTGL